MDTHQLQLTIADLVAGVHDSHHPIASGLYYEDQKGEALRRVVERPNIAAYLASDRRLPFNQEGILRRYRELDD